MNYNPVTEGKPVIWVIEAGRHHAFDMILEVGRHRLLIQILKDL